MLLHGSDCRRFQKIHGGIARWYMKKSVGLLVAFVLAHAVGELWSLAMACRWQSAAT
jgi:hypothetical protein